MIATGTLKSTALARWLLALALTFPGVSAAQNYAMATINPASGSGAVHAYTDKLLQIRLTDIATGSGIEFANITWSVVGNPAGATVTPTTVQTCGGITCLVSARGTASTNFRAPPGTYTVQASTPDFCNFDPGCTTGVNFNITVEQVGMAFIDPAGGGDSVFTGVSRNLEIYWGGPTLPKSGDNITWSIISQPSPGAGSLSVVTNPTDASGHSAVTFVGSSAGTYTIQAFNGCTFCSPISRNFTINVLAGSPAMAVDKVLSGYTDSDSSGDVTVGDILNYTVNAPNTVTTVLTNVVVADDHFAAQQSCATLNVGATCVLAGSYTVTAADERAGSVNNIGGARSSEFRAAIVDNEVTAVNTVVPAMTVTKTLPGYTDTDGSGNVTEGDVLNYRVTAHNAGNAVLTSVTVSDDHFATTQSCATVPVNTDCVLTGSYTVVRADVTAGSVSNTGSATSKQVIGPVTHTLATPVAPSPALTVTKTLARFDDNDGSGTVSVRDTLFYVVTAHNAGNVGLTGVQVSDDHFSNTQTCATLAINADCVLNGAYVVTPADAGSGSVTNIGQAFSNETRTPLTSSVNTPVDALAPAMSMSKSLVDTVDNDRSGSVTPGDVLSYAVIAHNAGNTVLTNVLVSDDHFPATRACASLALGADCILRGTYTVTASDQANGAVTNTGSATSTEVPGPVTAALTTPVATAPVLTVDKVLTGFSDNDNSGSVTQGDVLNYSVTAHNVGSVALANVLVSDDHFANTQACPSLPAGADCVLTGSYTVTAADVRARSVTNIGSASSTQAPGAVRDSVSTPVLTSPAITVTKTLDGYTDADRSGTITLGDTLAYTVTAHNAGNTPLGNVRVSDDHFSATQSCTSLSIGSDCVLAGNYTVTAADVQAGSITNTGSASSTEVPGAIRASVTTAVTPPPSTLTIVSGNGQTGVTGSTADLPLVVELRDGFGAPAANQAISWVVSAGTAGLSAASTLTDAAGHAQVNVKFASSAGTAVITASAASGSPSVSFNATSVNALSIAPASGDNQIGPVSMTLPLPLRVRITPPAGVSSIAGAGNQATRANDPFSLAGVPVSFVVTSGGGSVSVIQTVTDAAGEASTVFTLGPTPGVQTVMASVPGASTTFHATAFTLTGGLTVISGNNQTLPTNTVSAPLVVELRDALNVPAAGVGIHWTANNGTLAQATSVTDAQGRASNTVTVNLPGAASVSASSTLPAAGPVTFVINGAVANLPQLTGEQKAIARAIDALCPALAGMGTRTPGQQDLFLRCKEIVDSAGIDPASTVEALDQLFTDIALAQGNAAFDAAAAQFQNLKARIAALRSGTGGSSFGGLALNGPGGSIGLGTLASLFLGEGDQEIGSDFDRWGFFLSGNIGRGQSRAGSINPAYDYDLVGLSAGVDYRKSDKLVVGAALGYTSQDTELDRGRGNMDMSGFSVSGYGTYFTPNNWYGDFVLTWGKNDYDMQRSIHYTVPLPGGGSSTIDTEARSSSGGGMLEGAFTLGRDFQKGAWGLGPYARLLYTKVSFDQITEHITTGPGSGLALVIEPRDLTSIASQVGGKLTFTHSTAWGVLMPHFQLEWQHEYKDDVQQLSATFLNDPTRTAITVNGDSLDGSYFRVGVGLSMVLTRGRSGFFYYERMIGRDGLSQDNLALGLRMEF